MIRSTQGAEELVRKYEEQLKDVQAVPADLKALEATKAELKVTGQSRREGGVAEGFFPSWRSGGRGGGGSSLSQPGSMLRVPQRLRAQVEGHQPLFSTLEVDLGKANAVNERMVRGHSERDIDLDRYRERVQQLLERWQAVLAQIDLRQRELDQLGRQLRYYRECYDSLIQWIREARRRQEDLQAVPITGSQSVREQLLQEKVTPGLGWKRMARPASSTTSCTWSLSSEATSLGGRLATPPIGIGLSNGTDSPGKGAEQVFPACLLSSMWAEIRSCQIKNIGLILPPRW